MVRYTIGSGNVFKDIGCENPEELLEQANKQVRVIQMKVSYRDRLKCKWNDFKWFIRSIPYWFRLPKRYDRIVTGLSKKDYHDPEKVLLYGAMKCLEIYIENLRTEGDRNHAVEDILIWCEESLRDDPHCQLQYKRTKEAVAIYKWWKDYPNRLKSINDLYSKMNMTANCLEDWLEDEADCMLIRLMRIRQSLWT